MTTIPAASVFHRAREIYRRRPVLAAAVLASLLIVLTYLPAFIGWRIIPYDFQSDYYPWYVDSLRAFRISPVEMFDPYKLGGMMTFPLLAFYDLIDAAPGFVHAIPNLIGYQVLVLSHLFLIPVGIAMMFWARNVSPQRAILIVPIAIVAAALGPELKYVEWVKPVESYAYGFLVLGSLECLRAKTRLRYAILLGVALAFSFIYFGESAIFWPLVVIPYFLVYRDALLTRRGTVYGLAAGVIACAFILPCGLLTVKLFSTIQVSENIQILSTLQPIEAAGYLGIPIREMSLVSLPFALGVLVVLSFRTMRRAEQLFFGVFVAVAAIYSFSSLTPVATLVRAVYPIARLSRRPDVILYILIPVLVLLAVRAVAVTPNVPARFAAVAVGIFGFAALAVAVTEPEARLLIAGVAICVLPLAFLRDIRWWSAALVPQWLILCIIPYWTSGFSPQQLAPQEGYFAPFRSLEPFLPFVTPTSSSAFRVLSVGLPATFGSYAPVFQYYNVGADYGVIFPRELSARTGIKDLHAARIGAEIEADPSEIGSVGLRSMAVRYYLLSPDVYAAVAGALRRDPALVHLRVPGFWQVVRDDRAQPFLVADFADHSRTPVVGTMGRSWITFAPPAGSADVRLAFTFDPWWHVSVGRNGADELLRDVGGQLAVDTSNTGSAAITLHYGNARAVASIVLLMILYLVGAVSLVLIAGRSLLRSRSGRAAVKAQRRQVTVASKS